MDNLIKFWTVPDWKLLDTIAGHKNSVNSISVSPDSKVLASGSTDNTVKLWSFPSGELLHNLQDRKKVVAAVKISPNGQLIAAASYGGRAKIWTTNGEEVLSLKTASRNLTMLAFSPDNEFLATGGLGDNIEVWNIQTGELYQTLVGHQTAILSIKYIHDGDRLFTIGYEGTVLYWRTSKWEVESSFNVGVDKLRGAYIPSGDKIVAVVGEGRIHFRHLEDWKMVYDLDIGTKAVNGVSLSPDGLWFAVGAADKKIRVWRYHGLIS
jgi:WD40 repeat protein